MIGFRFHCAPCPVLGDHSRVGAGLTLALALGLAIGLVASSPPASAFEVARFYERSAEGWFWYAEEPPELEIPEPEPEPQPEPAPTPEPPPPLAQPSPPEEPGPSGPAPLSAAWLRENLERYRDQAIDDPSPTNVALYLYLQRMVLDKAERFAEATQRAVWSDPLLDETTRRPLATFAANLANREAGAARDAALKLIAEQAGLWFFYRADCPYCEAQAPLLDLLTTRYGLAVRAIALDGRPLPGGFFPSFATDAGQAKTLGVVSTPALFLVRPPAGVVPIAQGVLSLAELQERLVNAATEAGWIPEHWRERTRARVTDLRLDGTPLQDAERTDDPDQLLERLRSRAVLPSLPPLTPTPGTP
ncbi:conjugal transfer protein TraF [Halochromatium roseum]|uniref:conjugal transfer protein TraF n=1 Tax=Halochromatium roseum TaxID=391920 RepID=UPI001914BA40|nr:conjugal transfer protein TraF [Halochromatium roseum]MBK5938228.1 conjugal transfer protein TraF [Halochromatium roseum]